MDLDALLDLLADKLADRVAAKLANGNSNHAPEPDTLLDAKAAAARIGVSVRWLYSHDLPFAMRLPNSRAVRYSALGIERWIAKRQRGA